MAAEKWSQRTAASAGNLASTIYWVVVDTLGNSVRMTFAQMQTLYNAVTSMTGDGTISVTAGVATLTIGALKIVTGMLNDLAVTTGKLAANAVTFAKMQQIASGTLIGRGTASTGDAETITPNATYFAMSAGAITLSPGAIAQLGAVPTTLSADRTSVTTATLADVTGLSLSVSANTKYWFEFILIWQTNTNTDGPKFSVTVPSSPTALLFGIEINSAAAIGTDSMSVEWCTAGDAGTGISANDTSGVNRYARVAGWLSNGVNAGSVQLRFASFAAGATITVKSGSFGRLVLL